MPLTRDHAPIDSTAGSCPACSSSLLTDSTDTPWCERCEWNLDTVVRSPDDGLFAWLVSSLDRRAGFRADRRLAGTVADGGVSGSWATPAFLTLLLVSAVLLLLPVGALVVAVWLLVGAKTAVMPPLLLVAAAYALRPRLGSVRRLARGRYRLTPERQPALHRLVRNVAHALGAPMPDIVLLDDDFNAAAAVVGFRRTRVLVLGIPLLVALRRQELVALIGHELGHFHWADSRRALVTQPARTLFGRLSAVVEPPRGDVHDRELVGIYALFYTTWQLVAGALSWLLFVVHLGLNMLDAREGRRAEVRADVLAARAGGTTAALSMIDALALTPVLEPLVVPIGQPWGAFGIWRRSMETARERLRADLPRLRQLTIREDASLLASHPAPGRRYEVLQRMEHRDAQVAVTEGEGAVLDAELKPYVEALRKRLAEAYDL